MSFVSCGCEKHTFRHISRHFQQKVDKKNEFLPRHFLFHVSIGYLAAYAAAIYELEVSQSSSRCQYVDLNDKTINTGISVFGSQALGAERRRSPSLTDKVLRGHQLTNVGKLPNRWTDRHQFVHIYADSFRNETRLKKELYPRDPRWKFGGLM